MERISTLINQDEITVWIYRDNMFGGSSISITQAAEFEKTENERLEKIYFYLTKISLCCSKLVKNPLFLTVLLGTTCILVSPVNAKMLSSIKDQSRTVTKGSSVTEKLVKKTGKQILAECRQNQTPRRLTESSVKQLSAFQQIFIVEMGLKKDFFIQQIQQKDLLNIYLKPNRTEGLFLPLDDIQNISPLIFKSISISKNKVYLAVLTSSLIVQKTLTLLLKKKNYLFVKGGENQKELLPSVTKKISLVKICSLLVFILILSIMIERCIQVEYLNGLVMAQIRMLIEAKTLLDKVFELQDVKTSGKLRLLVKILSKQAKQTELYNQ
jgi:hypothetical protein